MNKAKKNPKSTPKEKENFYDGQWEINFAKLFEFKKIHGHCCVPLKYKEDTSLGLWVWRQRMLKSVKSYQKWFNEERAAKLDKIGFVWNLEENNWWKMYEELKKFHRKHGHCNPGKERKKNMKLANWIYHQRTYTRQHPEWYTKDKIKKLKAVGLFEDLVKKSWDDRYEEMKNFKKRYGHCDTTKHKKEYPTLNNWRQTNRERYMSGKLDARKVRKLNQIRFIWKIKDRGWDTMFNQLQSFMATNKDNADITPRSNNKKLSDWIYSQKLQYRKNSMRADRIRKLDE